jgi:hypothetical protein
MRGRFIAFFVLLAALSPAAAPATPDPCTGTWKLNLEKSRLPPPIPASQITHLTVEGDKISVREEITYASGHTAVLTIEARLDGKDYPVSGSSLADTIAYRRTGKRSIHGIAKQGGSVVEWEDVKVSEDAQTMTTIYTWRDAEGKEVTATAVFDRQS